MLGLLQIAPRLPCTRLAWAGGLASAWLLTELWGWLKGGGVFLFMLLLGGELRSKPHLALAACLPYIPLLLGVPASMGNFLWATAGVILALSALALGVPRWGNHGKDRPAAIALLSAGLAGLASAWAAGAASGEAARALLLGVVLAAGRAGARRPQVYSGRSQQLIASLTDLGKIALDSLDAWSFSFKPLLGGLAWAAWAGVLIQAAAGPPPGTAPAWSISGALWLGAGVGLGLWWAPGSLLRSLLLPALGGALGGWLANGQTGAIIGAGIGLGLGFGEWLAKKISDRAAE